MRIKNLAKGKNGRLSYYGYNDDGLDNLDKIARKETGWLCAFFRAENIELITNNVISIKRSCTRHTPFNEIPIGRKVKFIIGDPMEFIGIAVGVVRIEKCNCLEIEIIPGKLYFYSYISNFSKNCSFLELAP